MLALDRENLVVHELGPVVGAALGRCQGVRSLHDHIAHAWTTGLSPSPTAVADAVDSLVAYGLLRPLAAASQDEHTGHRSRGSLDTVAIITANRPLALSKALAHLRNNRPHPFKVIVIDGSGPAGDTTTAGLGAVKDSSSVTYIDASAAARLRDGLASAGIPRAVVDFGLSPGGIGSGRNLALFLTAGRPLLMQDDDVVARLWTNDKAEDGLSLGGHTDERAWGFFESRSEVHASIRNVGGDILAAHDAALGLSLDELIRQSEHVDYEHACAHMVAALHSAENRTLRVTFAGLAGDAARYCSHGPLFLAGPTRQQLWDNEAQFARAISSREVTVIARRLTVTHDPACVGYCMGVDNTRLVPPFMPVGRNEDGVWGATLAYVDPHALYGHLPVGIRHDSARPSRYHEPMASARQSRAADFLLFVVTRMAPATFATNPAARLRRLGRLFEEAGALPESDFKALVAEAKIGMMAQVLTQAEAVASDPACPQHWRQATEEYRRAFRESVVRPEYFLPIEFANDSLDGFQRMQQFVADFGAFLTWWPEIWDAGQSMVEAHPHS